jgi:hypothetical protein
MGFWCSWWILRGEGIEEEGMGKEDIKAGSLCLCLWVDFIDCFFENLLKKKNPLFFCCK